MIAGVAGADHGIRGFVAAFQRRYRRPRLAPLDRAPPRRARHRNLAGQGADHRRRFHLAHRLLRRRPPTRSTGPPAIPGPTATIAIVPATISTPIASSRSTRKTGDLKWHYQFTPHDVKDRDATEPNVLVDTDYHGKPSKLLLHADRNGFFYVLDRTDGKVLLAKPFLRRVDWAYEHRT